MTVRKGKLPKRGRGLGQLGDKRGKVGKGSGTEGKVRNRDAMRGGVYTYSYSTSTNSRSKLKDKLKVKD